MRESLGGQLLPDCADSALRASRSLCAPGGGPSHGLHERRVKTGSPHPPTTLLGLTRPTPPAPLASCLAPQFSGNPRHQPDMVGPEGGSQVQNWQNGEAGRTRLAEKASRPPGLEVSQSLIQMLEDKGLFDDISHAQAPCLIDLLR